MRNKMPIDDKFGEDALCTSDAKTKREVAEQGQKTQMILRKQERARQLRGQIAWRGDLEKMRIDL